MLGGGKMIPVWLILGTEWIYHVEWEDWENNAGHREDYRIAELVAARSRGQARYLAWKADKTFTGDMREMPRFVTHKTPLSVGGIPRVVTSEHQGPEDGALWVKP
jgi:hypothetical protein